LSNMRLLTRLERKARLRQDEKGVNAGPTCAATPKRAPRPLLLIQKESARRRGWSTGFKSGQTSKKVRRTLHRKPSPIAASWPSAVKIGGGSCLVETLTDWLNGGGTGQALTLSAPFFDLSPAGAGVVSDGDQCCDGGLRRVATLCFGTVVISDDFRCCDERMRWLTNLSAGDDEISDGCWRDRVVADSFDFGSGGSGRVTGGAGGGHVGDGGSLCL